MRPQTSTLPLLVFAALVLLATPGAVADDLPIVEKSIGFHGGDRFGHSVISFTITSKSGSFDATVRQDGGLYRYEVIADTDEGERTVVATNDDVKLSIDGEPRPVPDDRKQAWRDHVSARIYFPLLPYRLADPGVQQEDQGLETWPGENGRDRELHRVKVTFETGTSTDAEDEYLYWFDPGTGRLEQFAYSFRGGLRFREGFNFRRVGGILFSDQKNYAIDWDDPKQAIPVDAIGPEFVDAKMEHLSTVRLENIEVEPLTD